MADFTTMEVQINNASASDAIPNWTAPAIAPGGTGGANELRFGPAGNTATTGSGAWQGFPRPGSVSAVPELWAFSADTTGVKSLYDGTNGKANILRFHGDNLATPASAAQFSCFATSALPTPVPGTQPSSPSTDGSGIVNGQTTDTSNHAYLKGAAYGPGIDAAGTQYTPSAGAIGTAPSGTTGSAGAVTTSAIGAWSAWQDLQGWTDYILAGAQWKALTTVFWYFSLILFSGPNLCLGQNIGPVLVLQYNYT